MKVRYVVVCLLLILAFARPSSAAIFGSVKGLVHGPDHRPISAAIVTLHAGASALTSTASTDAAGEFSFVAIPVGRYRATVAADGFSPAEQSFALFSSGGPLLHFALQLPVARQSVEVAANAEAVTPESATTTTLIGRDDIRNAPGADRSNSLAMITNFVPGAYVTHDQLHVRGGHQVTWSVDGVPVPNTNIASNVGPQFDPKDIDYLEVQRGSYSAEYGDRSYGVFNVVPRTGFERNREAELVASFGSFFQSNDQLSFGDHTARFAWYASVNGNRSDLGLETPAPQVIHDRGSGLGGFANLIFNATPRDQLRLTTSVRRDDYQIPNTANAQKAGVRDNERERDGFVNFSWVRTTAAGFVFTASPFYHMNRAAYEGGLRDPGISPSDRQDSQYAGAQIAVNGATRRHNLRLGVYGFGQTGARTFDLRKSEHPENPLRQEQNSSGYLAAAFLEDQFKLTPWLTLNGGVRLTRFGGAISESAASPRVGAALRIPKLNWVLRGFYGRFYQAPPLSTLSGPLLDFATNAGLGFLPLRGERDEEKQFGLSIPIRGWAIDLDNFHTRAANFFDHNVLGNSNIFFPLTIHAAHVRGWEVTLRSPRLFHRAQLHLAYSLQHAEGQGGVNGGLTDFSPPAGRFLLDHDQRHTLNAGFESTLPGHAFASGNVYYGSGFADQNGPSHLPGHTTVDMAIGKSIGERASVSLNAINLANRRFLLDSSNTFGGTHFANPREIFAQVRYRFRF